MLEYVRSLSVAGFLVIANYALYPKNNSATEFTDLRSFWIREIRGVFAFGPIGGIFIRLHRRKESRIE
jgi:hypothetical protein